MSRSVKDLKAALKQLGVSTDGLLEKDELIRALRDAEASRESQPSSSSQENSTSELKDVIRHLAGRTTGCFEKTDLISRARLLLNDRKAKACPVCLDELLDDARSIIYLNCCPKIHN